MKRLTLLLIFIGATWSSLAQNRIDFFDFAQSFDWKLSESAFKEKYKDRIVIGTDSIPDFHAATGQWMLKDVYIGDYETQTFVRYNEQPQGIMIVSLPTVCLDSINYTACTDIEELINRKLGSPDLLFKDTALTSDNTGNTGLLGFEKGDFKIWKSTTPIFMITTAGNEKHRGIFITAIPQREADFRKGFWGDSMADIKRKEGKPDEFDMEGIYMFRTYVAGLECACAYRFTHDKLTSGKYIFINNNSDNCVDNYNKLVGLLTKKYGEPFSSDKETTASSSYKQKFYTEGELVRDGDMKFETYWATPFSTVAIFLRGEQEQISICIEYYSNELRKEREQDILNDF